MLPTGCPHCGNINPTESRFCNQCGRALSAGDASPQTQSTRAPRDYTPGHLAEQILNSRSALEGERKQVTILFADLKGSTQLASRLDPEEWHRILDRYFEILAAGIHQFEGTINQYTGDGVMALFGAPVAHEDHALRACFASLNVQQAMTTFADELRLSQGIDLSARIGLNSGEVVVGKIGDDLRMDYTAQGHTVNLAARMEQIAAPGKIFLTRQTAHFVDGYCTLRDLGESTIKGSDDPVQVYELTGTGQISTRLQRSQQRGFSTFIGRDTEYAVLQRHLEIAQTGKPQIVSIVGDAGLGKSRLCHEFTENLANRGMRVLRGTGVPHGQAVPLFPIVGLLRDAFGIVDTDNHETQRRKIAGTLALLETSCTEDRALVFELMGIDLKANESTDLGPEKRQERLACIARAVCLPESDELSVLLIEDWHWLDDSSIEFLHAMLMPDDDAPIASQYLLMVNHRPGLDDSHLDHHVHHCIELQPLNDQDLHQLMHEWMGDADSIGSLADRLVAMAAGNPFFIEEAVQSLVESGSLAGQFGAYELTETLEELQIPATVEAVLAARIDRLQEDVKNVLQTAAVIGKDFSAALLSEVADADDETIESALSTLKAGNYIFEPEAEESTPRAIRELRFRHPLTREIAYKSQLRDRRQRLHKKLAALVESQLEDPENPGELSVFLAHHWKQADELGKAMQWHIKAAQWGALRNLNQSVSMFRQAVALTPLSALENADAPLINQSIAARAGVIRADALSVLPSDEVDQAWIDGKTLAEKHNDRFGFIELLISEGGRRLHSGNADEAVDLTRQALNLVQETGNTDLVGRFRIPILLSHFGAGQLQQGLDSLDGNWDSVPIDTNNFGSRAMRSLILAYQGRLADARREIDRCLVVGANEGRSVSWMHANLVDINYFAGEREGTMHHAHLAVSNAEEYGSPFFRVIAYLAMADALIQQKRYTEARELLEKHRHLTRPCGPVHQYEGVHLCTIAACLTGEGEWQEGLGLTEQAIETSVQAHWRIWEGRARLEHCRALRFCFGEDAGDKLQEQYQRLEQLIETTSAKIFHPYLLLEKAKMARLQGNESGSIAHLKQAREVFKACGAMPYAQHLGAVIERIDQPAKEADASQ